MLEYCPQLIHAIGQFRVAVLNLLNTIFKISLARFLYRLGARPLSLAHGSLMLSDLSAVIGFSLSLRAGGVSRSGSYHAAES
jgi:hypothetical protein